MLRPIFYIDINTHIDRKWKTMQNLFWKSNFSKAYIANYLLQNLQGHLSVVQSVIFSLKTYTEAATGGVL